MIAYLDNSATTRPTEPVIDAMNECMRGGFYNPSSLYAPALVAERAMDRCRGAIVRSVNAPAGRVTFTSGGTESNNLAILGAVRAMRGPRHVITSVVEHPSVLAAFEALRSQGHRVTLISVDAQGAPDWAQLECALKESPSLVSFMQVNNEVGTILDAPRLSAMVRTHAPDALLHVDGVQGYLRTAFDARLVDLYTLSAHKLGGPKGVGALWVRQGVRLAPQHLGGDQELTLRSGTENTPGIAGLMAAIEHMPPDASEKMRALKMRLIDGFKAAVPALTVNGPPPDQAAPHIINMSLVGVRGEVMLHALEGEGVYCSTGSACSSKKRKLSPVLTNMSLPLNRAESALRFSLCPDTTQQEIDYATEKAGALYAALSRFKRR